MKEYFSHDYGARNDRKMTRLVMKHGMQGIGIFWCIIEMLYEEGGYLPLEYERITFELRTEYDIVKSVIHDFDLFEFDNDLFYSNSILTRLGERAEKSEKARESINARWDKYRKNKDNTNVIRTYNDSNTIKEKKSKEKESKEVYAENVLMEKVDYDKLILQHGEKNTKIFIEILDNYKGANGKKYKDDYRAILNWVIDKAKKDCKYIEKPKLAS